MAFYCTPVNIRPHWDALAGRTFVHIEFDMGHQYSSPYPRTPRWKRAIALIADGATAETVAAASTAAAEKGLLRAANDPGVVEAVWLLMHLPMAARSDDFADGLRACGMDVPDDPGLMEVVGAAADALDASLPGNRGRTDLGEMAQQAAHETIAAVVGDRLKLNLFETNAEDVRAEFARLGTRAEFGRFAREFFTRFVGRCLGFYLDRVLPDFTGAGRRFPNLDAVAGFREEMDTHCRETARAMEEYSGGWFDAERYRSGGEVSRDEVRKFIGYGMKKLTGSLRQGGHAHAS